MGNWLEEAAGGIQSQRSAAWYEWRKKHIGASDVPAVMGECDFKKPHELWLLKTGRKQPFAGNAFTQRGIDAEPEIRRLYEALVGFETEAPVLEYKDWPVLSASLDAINWGKQRGAEFKYPSALKHVMAQDGCIPKTYYGQLQAQMLVADLTDWDYVSFDGQAIVVVTLPQNRAYQAAMLDKCREFWHHVVNDIEPPGGVTPREGEELMALAQRFLVSRQTLRDQEAEMDHIRSELARLVPETRASFYGLTLTRSKTGSIIIK